MSTSRCCIPFIAGSLFLLEYKMSDGQAILYHGGIEMIRSKCINTETQ